MPEDWRLSGQDRYLTGARLRRATYRAPSPTWDHDHCEFCNAKFAERDSANVLREGWQTEDEYRWVCSPCFEDFQEAFGFKSIDASAPLRVVELHDVRIEEIRRSGGDVVVRPHAFVHDDRTSCSCAGEWQSVEVRLQDATVEQSERGDGWVLDGSVRIDADCFDDMLQLPLRRAGAVAPVLSGVGLLVAVHARSVWLVVAGPPGCREAGA